MFKLKINRIPTGHTTSALSWDFKKSIPDIEYWYFFHKSWNISDF